VNNQKKTVNQYRPVKIELYVVIVHHHLVFFIPKFARPWPWSRKISLGLGL